MLSRLFFAFPRGFQGIALLLLRVVLGVAVMIEGTYYLEHPAAAPANIVASLFALGAGFLLSIGFLTPFASAVVGIDSIGMLLSPLGMSAPNIFESRAALIFGFTMLLAIASLGPGAFSIDARIFGRREIIIPPPSHSKTTPPQTFSGS